MKLDWNQFVGKMLNITMFENYGVVYGKEKGEHPTFYEIVFKTGKLVQSFDDGLLIESNREEKTFQVYVPYNSIKCVEIF
ncbi:MAG: hypothetical protein NTX65_02900 [Ignavibacteriales bacterium]|nr:hypothetical protein [Ignavibacteriales bacterium]